MSGREDYCANSPVLAASSIISTAGCCSFRSAEIA